MKKKRTCEASDERIAHSALNREGMKRYKAFFLFTTSTTHPSPAESTSGTNSLNIRGFR